METKMFVILKYSDGGPNDKGRVIGYIEATSGLEARKLAGITTGFEDCIEITREKYESEKKKAIEVMKMFIY